MKDEEKIISAGLLEGGLVQVLNEFGTLSLPAIYLGTVRPGYVGIWEDDLLWELEHLDDDLAPSRSLVEPLHWHHVLLVKGRLVHLNTTQYTLLPLPGEETSSEPHT
jgi:hypothetical protein